MWAQLDPKPHHVQPTSLKKKKADSLPQSSSKSFREIHTTYDCALNFLLSYMPSVIFNLSFPLAIWRICCSCSEEKYLSEDWLARNTCIFVNEFQRHSTKQGILGAKRTEMCSCFPYQHWSSLPFSFIFFLSLWCDQIISLFLIHPNLSWNSDEGKKIKFITFVS